MGGVINITTKRGRETPNISAFSEYGSFTDNSRRRQYDRKKGAFDLAADDLPMGYVQLLGHQLSARGDRT